ncbi:hypothetical protein QYE76_008392 [Lolium multiflorum]|uniref:Uncharacterized protein n=1 Tax=Lolium multiflorum TaxID=4521 RepID=A0AAD8TT93_LOLMU|nr:hypothetical protein QYE76_008392 [Lolium multiflorum]
MMAAVQADLLDIGFPRILWDCLQLCGFDRKPVYTTEEHEVDETRREYVAKIVVLARPTLDQCPYRFTGPRMPSESLAVQLVAREAIRLLRGALPEMRQRACCYFPFKEGPQAQSVIKDSIKEEDLALTHQTFFTIAEDRVLDEIIEELTEARQDLHQTQDRLRILEERHASERRGIRVSRGGVPIFRDIYVEGEQPMREARLTSRRYLCQFRRTAPRDEGQPSEQSPRADPAASSATALDHTPDESEEEEDPEEPVLE